ncbi:diadenylate cyclase CdaA [bacterium]|nr:diadenylate cyclase CdaA [bacterium]
MYSSVSTVIKEFSYLDVLDILLVSSFFYYVLLAIKGTRAVQILQGLVALFVLRGIAYILQLQTFSYILNGILVSTVVALPVVFQPELRRALTRLGMRGILYSAEEDGAEREDLTKSIGEIAFAAYNLSSVRFGALIVLERNNGLQEVIETGKLIKGVISANLLQTIFRPKTPLHDGAVIIRNNRIWAASCYLPLTDSVLDSRFGTRHRAAMGISEQSDAVVIVVSEETGEIRIVHDGVFSQAMTEENQIKKALYKELITDTSVKKRSAWTGFLGLGKEEKTGDN